MRALVIKETSLGYIPINSIIEGEIEGDNFCFVFKDIKHKIALDYLIFEGAQWQVVKAANEGKSLENWRADLREWRKKSSGTFYSDSFYRIAPEAPKPKYVPFTSEDWEMFVGKVIKNDRIKVFAIVTSWDKHEIYIGEECFSYENAFTICIFLDGSPFGKLQQ